MENTSVILMEKDKESGFLVKEIESYTIENGELIKGIYLIEDNDEKKVVVMRLATDRDVEDWEYAAIYDYYDDEVLEKEVLTVSDVEDCYNPTWEVTLKFDHNQVSMEHKLTSIVELHNNELNRVYEEIKNKKEEYTEEATE